METPQYAVFLFLSVGHALKAEKILKDHGIAQKLIPVPRHISTDCGVCLRVETNQQDQAEEALRGRAAWERLVLL